MAKCNVRSFRYDEEVRQIIESFVGHSYNEKFENLVKTCYYDLPRMKERIKRAEADLSALEQRCAAKRREFVNLNQLEQDQKNMQSDYAEFIDSMRKLAMRANEL